MTKPLPRTSFSSPRLIRLLAALAGEVSAGAKSSKPSLAERLGQWLDLSDAIALAGALATGSGRAAAAPVRADAAGATDAQPTPAADYARVRALLAGAIDGDGPARPGRPRNRLPAPAGAADFLPYRRYYVAHQRDMEADIGDLRAGLRSALTLGAPTQVQLAALDAALETALAERERSLLGNVPWLLERRFAQLRAAAPSAAGIDGDGEGEEETGTSPAPWLATFCAEMRAVLLAELDFRLQPVAGLVEALGYEVSKQQ